MAPTAAAPGVLLVLLLLGGVAPDVEFTTPVAVTIPVLRAGMVVVLVVPLLSVPLRQVFCKMIDAGLSVLV